MGSNFPCHVVQGSSLCHPLLFYRDVVTYGCGVCHHSFFVQAFVDTGVWLIVCKMSIVLLRFHNKGIVYYGASSITAAAYKL